MNSHHIYELRSENDSDELKRRPVERLCDLLLRESIRARFAALRLVVADGQAAVAQAHAAGEWMDIMKFPMPVYSALTTQLKAVAGLLPEPIADQESRFVVRESVRDTTILPEWPMLRRLSNTCRARARE